MRFQDALKVGVVLAGTFWANGAIAQDATQAGVTAAVRGEVLVARSEAVGRQVASGESVFLQDGIQSGPNSGMQILLMDETVFTIGPESELTIDEYVYDPATQQGSLVAEMAKGTMRFVTGNIASGTPENMQIKLPVGTIGIRGTDGVIAVLTQEQAAQSFPDQAPQLGGNAGGDVVFAALNGPGPQSNAGNGTGSFNFSTPNGDVDLNRPGGAVLAAPGQPPVTFLAPPGSIQQVTTSLSSNQGNDDDSSGSTGNNGQNTASTGSGGTAGGGSGSGGTGNTSQQSGSGSDSSLNSVGSLVNNTSGLNNAGSTAQSVANSTGGGSGGNTLQDIINAFPGESTVSGSGNLTGGVGGSFSTSVNFSARTVDINASINEINGSPISTMTVVTNNSNGVAIGLSSTGFDITSSNNTGTCSDCTGSVSFPSSTQVELTVQYSSSTGSGTADLSGGM